MPSLLCILHRLVLAEMSMYPSVHFSRGELCKLVIYFSHLFIEMLNKWFIYWCCGVYQERFVHLLSTMCTVEHGDWVLQSHQSAYFIGSLNEILTQSPVPSNL